MLTQLGLQNNWGGPLEKGRTASQTSYGFGLPRQSQRPVSRTQVKYCVLLCFVFSVQVRGGDLCLLPPGWIYWRQFWTRHEFRTLSLLLHVVSVWSAPLATSIKQSTAQTSPPLSCLPWLSQAESIPPSSEVCLSMAKWTVSCFRDAG